MADLSNTVNRSKMVDLSNMGGLSNMVDLSNLYGDLLLFGGPLQ
jgi:hypothetical protein